MKKILSPRPATFAISATEHLRNSRNSENSQTPGLVLDFPTWLKQISLSDNSDSRSLTNEEWLDTEAAAVYLKLSVGSLRNMTSNGLIPYNKLGRRNRYRTEDLRQLLLSNRRGALHGN